MRTYTLRLGLPLSATLLLACASANNAPGGDGAVAHHDGATTRDGATTGGDDGGTTLDDLGGAAIDLAMSGVDLQAPIDLLPGSSADLAPTLSVGSGCTMDGECMTGLCKPVVAGDPSGPAKVCVANCKSQTDCAIYGTTYFCEAITQGSSSGYCIPHSAAHCLSCTQDSDCGSLAEKCVQAAGDIAKACHIDCTLAPFDACPPDYTCKLDSQTKTGLCVPTVNVCLDAIGGYCDRVSLDQFCTRTNTAGTCSGYRTCKNGRYTACGAMAPQFKASCTDQDPAGCMEQFAPTAATTVQNCGTCGHSCAAGQGCCGGVCTNLGTNANCASCGNACGSGQACCGNACTDVSMTNDVNNCGGCNNVCPGVGNPTDIPLCSNPSQKQCSLECITENYDVDGNPANGCEQLHTMSSGHTMNTAEALPSKGCNDSASQTSYSGTMLSDSRPHVNPDGSAWLPGVFSGTVGDAPDWWSIIGTGSCSGFACTCVNDYAFTFTTSGGGNTPCYSATIRTDKGVTDTVTVTGNGSGSASRGCCGQYSNGGLITFEIQKTCSLPTQESVSYTVSFHL